ncbi:MAG TPA: DUF6093 family protein [Solirubrobacteraceae bacterium]|nr:DUF6093 family protein [Solirubrobacteraceae bacterium]
MEGAVSARSVTLRGRVLAEKNMLDIVRITAPAIGPPQWDDDAGEYVDPEPVEVYGPSVEPYRGKSRWRNAYPAPQSVQAGSAEWAKDIVIISLPVDGAAMVANGVEIELVSSALDPGSNGARASVMADHVQTFSTACRVPAQLVSRHV